MDVMVEELKKGLEAAYQLHIQLTERLTEKEQCDNEELMAIILEAFHNCMSIMMNPQLQDPSLCNKGRQSHPVLITTELKDDGYKWRKYGKKRIISSKYPREYYKCRYRENGCRASKYVQMICDFPTKYGVVYIGTHTCEYLSANEAQFDPLNLQFLVSDTPNMLCFAKSTKPKLESN